MSEGAVHVFCGPTLGLRRIQAELPGASVHGPIAHLDVLRLDLKAGDLVAVIDGVFLRSAPVRHKELLELLDRGVDVWGASSMGALRAAELNQYGMRGVGLVYRLFRDGVLDRDDEVAVAHLDAAHGYRQLSVSLVAVRVAARRARHARLIGCDTELAMVRSTESLPFRDRDLNLIANRAIAAGGDQAECQRLASLMRRPEWDVKREDAERLLRTLPRLPPGKAVPRPNARGRTRYERRWAEATTGERIGGAFVTDAAALAFCQLFAVDYPQFHTRIALRAIVDLGPASPLPRHLDDQALALAAARGYLGPEGDLYPGLAWWLTASERRSDASQAAIRALVRSFRFRPGLDLGPVALESLRTRPVFQEAQKRVAAAQELGQGLSDRDRRFVPANISPQRVERMFRERWGIANARPEFRAAYRDRGFLSEPHFTRMARPFVAYAIATDIPALSVDEDSELPNL